MDSCLSNGREAGQGGSAWGILYEVNTCLVVRTQGEALGTNVSYDVISNHMYGVAGLNYTQSTSGDRENLLLFLKSYFKVYVCVPVCGQVPIESGGTGSYMLLFATQCVC